MKKFSKLYERILLEMSDMAVPSEIHPYDTIKAYWSLHKANAEFIENRLIDGKTKVDIYFHQSPNSNSVSFYFFRGPLLAACINGEVSDNGGFHIRETLKIGGAAGFFMSDIIKNFILSEFEYALSDKIHTPQGFQVYEFLINDPKIHMQVYNNSMKSFNEIKSIDELRSYYGPNKGDYQFRVELK